MDGIDLGLYPQPRFVYIGPCDKLGLLWCLCLPCGASHIKKFAELCHCSTYIAAVANYVNKCIDIVVKIAKLRFKKFVTKNQSLVLHFPRFNQNKRIFAVTFRYSFPPLSKIFVRQIYF